MEFNYIVPEMEILITKYKIVPLYYLATFHHCV